jgi:hypothetical protein
MITKDWCTYSIRILHQDWILRDHELPGVPLYAVSPEFPDCTRPLERRWRGDEAHAA